MAVSLSVATHQGSLSVAYRLYLPQDCADNPVPPGRGRPAKRLRHDETHEPGSGKTPAMELAADAWRQITWRDGSNTPLTIAVLTMAGPPGA